MVSILTQERRVLIWKKGGSNLRVIEEANRFSFTETNLYVGTA